MGFTSKNFNEPNISIYKRDIVPYENKIGLAYELSGVTVALDRLQMNNSNKDRKTFIGAEKWYGNAAVRTGYAFGNNNYSKYAFGMSYVFELQKMNIQIDYSFDRRLDEGMKDMGGNHNVSTSLKF